MYMHIGGDYIISKKDIIGIYDIKTTTVDKSSKEFLELSKAEGKVIEIYPKAKSFIVTSDKVYMSPISAFTLAKRAHMDIR